MKESGQLQAAATVPWRKEPLVFIKYQVGWGHRQYGLFGEEVQPKVWSLMTEISWFLYFYESEKNGCDGLGVLVWGDKKQEWQVEIKFGNIVRIVCFI
jgi:hypothetical protein